ncbi:MAG: CheY-like chemotaxis protein [Gammaproteobacteria bacterium]
MNNQAPPLSTTAYIDGDAEIPLAPPSVSKVLVMSPVEQHEAAHVLVVDDETALRELLRIQLSTWGYAVSSENDGPAALACLLDNPNKFDVVIIDQTMPGLLGSQVIQALQYSPHPPFILCTGYVDNMDEARAKSLGALALLTKPTRAIVLRPLLAELLGRKAPRNPQ